MRRPQLTTTCSAWEQVQFTCNLCGEVSTKAVSPHAWASGSVFARCDGCRVNWPAKKIKPSELCRRDARAGDGDRVADRHRSQALGDLRRATQ